MMTLHTVNKPEEQPVVWGGFPSWSQFSWLYLLSAISVLRGALLFRFGVAGVADVDAGGRDPAGLCRDPATVGAL